MGKTCLNLYLRWAYCLSVNTGPWYWVHAFRGHGVVRQHDGLQTWKDHSQQTKANLTESTYTKRCVFLNLIDSDSVVSFSVRAATDSFSGYKLDKRFTPVRWFLYVIAHTTIDCLQKCIQKKLPSNRKKSNTTGSRVISGKMPWDLLPSHQVIKRTTVHNCYCAGLDDRGEWRDKNTSCFFKIFPKKYIIS